LVASINAAMSAGLVKSSSDLACYRPPDRF
jgi:hypothetical protein